MELILHRSINRLIILILLLLSHAVAQIGSSSVAKAVTTTATSDVSQVYAFMPDFDNDNYKQYDWSRLSTICVFNVSIDDLDNESKTNTSLHSRVHDIVRTAHNHGVNVDIAVFYSVTNLKDIDYRNKYIAAIIKAVSTFQFDGVNVDVEFIINEHDTKTRDALTSLMKALRNALDDDNNFTGGNEKKKSLSFDAAWSPNGIDKRFYDINAIAPFVDMIFVMAYDMQSQIFDTNYCIAKANSPILRVQEGLQQFLNLSNVNASKLVLGLPWYGYDYPCINNNKYAKKSDDNNICYIEHVPFRDAPCSDAAGKQQPLSIILSQLSPNITDGDGIRWDKKSQSPFFNYYPDPNNSNRFHQVRFDSPRSLIAKYRLAKTMKLGGIGCWNINALDYGTSIFAKILRQTMFEALDVFLKDDNDEDTMSLF